MTLNSETSKDINKSQILVDKNANKIENKVWEGENIENHLQTS